MEWFSQNWIWIALIGGMGAMHLFGHKKGGGGCCGGHNNDKSKSDGVHKEIGKKKGD